MAHQIMEYSFDLDPKGYLKKRESFDLEYKQSFQYGDPLLRYAKTLAGMANNRGGQIIFGVKDKPHSPIGLQDDKFTLCDPGKFDRILREYFSNEIEWGMQVLNFDGKEFGQIWVNECQTKPILCKKVKDGCLREGVIYYRYRGETREIEYSELSKMLAKEKEKEKLLWMSHIERIATIGPQNIHLLDTKTGELGVGKGRILIDERVVEKIKFIREGSFCETEGAPTLKLIGEIQESAIPSLIPATDTLFPLFAKDIGESLEFELLQNSVHLMETENKGRCEISY